MDYFKFVTYLILCNCFLIESTKRDIRKRFERLPQKLIVILIVVIHFCVKKRSFMISTVIIYLFKLNFNFLNHFNKNKNLKFSVYLYLNIYNKYTE